MKEIRILVAARRDLMAGYRFYEKQAPGIGRYFLDTMYSDIESLRIHAGVHALYFGNYHRLLSRRFPWSVYYRVNADEIHVYAIFDSRRNPDLIKRRLAGVQEL
ncbi:MAG: type II toxin-antitoxin system RelE/ParE family toxin [Gammaproteobacteria bacterium]|nr:type II toxin-antitoxin system RelE/ParE family toxin [Gammaproteobacteria bacterium]